MPIEDRTWDLDRSPTKAERTIGIFVATLLFLLTSAFLSVVTYQLYLSGKFESDTGWLFAISVLLFLAAAVLLWRIAFTKPSKPASSAISVIGYVILGSGIASLLLCTIYGTNNSRAIWMGLIAVAGGAVLVRKNGKRPREL